MHKRLVMSPTMNYEFKFNINNIEYEIRILDYTNVAGYAKVLVKDLTNGNSYISDGCITINDMTIYTTWNIEYDANRDNYICGKELEVSIDY